MPVYVSTAARVVSSVVVLVFSAANDVSRAVRVVSSVETFSAAAVFVSQDGREVFVLSTSLPVNYIPIENDTIEFDLEIQVRSSGSEKLHARNIAFLSMSQLIERLSSSSSSF